MSIHTMSAFYFGHTVTSINGSIDFTELGGPEIQTTLNPGDYTLEEFAVEVQRALNAAGDLTYTATVNRATRQITIAATGTFSLLTATGTRFGSGAWEMMGFTTPNKTGASTYTGANPSGSIYLPQAKLRDYVSDEDYQEKTDAVVNTSASGKVQVVLFGDTQFFELGIVLATNNIISKLQDGIETQVNGVQNLRTFMRYAITKAKFEFMPDRDNRNSFRKVILESTPKSRDGTAYMLTERPDAFGYYETGKLTLRVVE